MGITGITGIMGPHLFEREEGGERVQRVVDEVVRTDARAAELQIRLDDRRRQLDAVRCSARTHMWANQRTKQWSEREHSKVAKVRGEGFPQFFLETQKKYALEEQIYLLCAVQYGRQLQNPSRSVLGNDT
jgi:hypothetical protein